MTKTLVAIGFQVFLLGAFLLVPALTVYWIDALIWLTIYALVIGSGTVYLVLYHPGGIAARFRFRLDKQPFLDKLAIAFLLISIIIGFILCPLDLFHWQLAEAPPKILRIIGLFLYILGMIVALAAHVTNNFISPTVHIQERHGHKVVDTGLYAYVRHPMYAGILLIVIGSLLWLGTYFSLTVGSFLTTLSLTFRMNIEEKILTSDLDGYREYSKRVRTRIIPFLI